MKICSIYKDRLHSKTVLKQLENKKYENKN